MHTVTAKIFVAAVHVCPHAHDHGDWIGLELKDGDDIQTEIDSILETPCPKCRQADFTEWKITQWDFEDVNLGESPDLDDIASAFEAMEKHGADVFKAALSNFHNNVDQAVSACDDSFQGTFRTLADYGKSFLQESGQLSEIPSNLRQYFDFDSYASDMEKDGSIWTAETSDGIAVFNND